MPADAREQITRLPSGKWRLRYYDRDGVRHSGGVFPSKSAAREHYDEVVKADLDGRPVARRDLTLQELADVFLERHGGRRVEANHPDAQGAPLAAPGRLRTRSCGRVSNG